jgi:hypothetical protein
MNDKNKVWYAKVDGKDVPTTEKGGWVKIDGEDVWTNNQYMPTDNYNQARIDNFLKMIDEEVKIAEKEIKLIEKRRDKKINMYSDLAREEEAKKL